MTFKLFLRIIFVSMLSVLCLADDSCTADTSQYNQEGLKNRISVFNPKGPSIEKVYPSRLIEFGFEDHASLKNGLDVIYTVGGCAHYAYSFTFKGQKIRKLEKPPAKLKRAANLLNKLDLNDPKEKDLLLKSIKEAQKKKLLEQEPGILVLPCGDANCSLVDLGNQEIKIQYDFAL